jgi:molybdate transport system substrate-binding protein
MFRVASTALLLCTFTAIQADAADIKILSPGATEGVLNELLPQFEKTSGHRVTINYGPAGAIAARVRKGEPADVLITSEPQAERLRKEGKTIDGSLTVVAKVGIGVFVRKGDPKPDISTADKFLRALATAKVIAYADPKLGGSVSILVGKLLTSVDVTGSIKERTRLVPPAKPLVDLVAGGGIDFGFQPVAQIFLDRGSSMSGRSRRRTSTTPIMWPVWSRPANSRRLTRRC